MPFWARSNHRRFRIIENTLLMRLMPALLRAVVISQAMQMSGGMPASALLIACRQLFLCRRGRRWLSARAGATLVEARLSYEGNSMPLSGIGDATHGAVKCLGERLVELPPIRRRHLRAAASGCASRWR